MEGRRSGLWAPGYMYIFYKNSLEFYISYMPDVFTEFK